MPNEPKETYSRRPSVVGEPAAYECVSWCPSCGTFSAATWCQRSLPVFRSKQYTTNCTYSDGGSVFRSNFGSTFGRSSGLAFLSVGTAVTTNTRSPQTI